VKVKSYEVYKAEERPVEFQLGERVYGVRAVLDQWYEPSCTYFKGKASDGNIYVLKHSLSGGYRDGSKMRMAGFVVSC